MRKNTEYAILVAFVISYMVAFMAAYLVFKDNPESMTISFCMIALAIMGITMVLSVIIIDSNRTDVIKEYDERRMEEGRKKQS